MAIDSAYKTIQHAASLQDQNLEVAQDGVEQSRFGRPSSRTVGTEKDVKYEIRPVRVEWMSALNIIHIIVNRYIWVIQ